MIIIMVFNKVSLYGHTVYTYVANMYVCYVYNKYDTCVCIYLVNSCDSTDYIMAYSLIKKINYIYFFIMLA